MDRSFRARADAILGRALDAPAAEREALVARECGDDVALRTLVERLLSHVASPSDDLEPGGALDGPLWNMPDSEAETTSSDREDPADVVGSPAGDYRVLEKLGEGGMGEVYAAEQRTPVRRRVALKIVKRGMDSRQVVQRFESERQALALMDHPSIARIFDAGMTPDHRPFFAMELVRGQPITQYCDEHRLPLAERLRLIVLVCAAVQHAHRKAVIHRDLKPSNILVTEQDGQAVPKIIDFGVAKAMAQPLGEQPLYTALGQIIGTPAYMSPEQADPSGADVDTRTDVYSLGAVLYELLVGERPLDVTTGAQSYDEIVRIIREQEPVRPSTRVGLAVGSEQSALLRRIVPSRWGRALRGDLDWITMRALEKDRERRYQSPAELAADVERHLRGEAVSASPPTMRYRAGRFFRRHRAFALAVAATSVAVLAGLVATSWQAVRATRAERAATRAASRATSVNEFLIEMLAAANPRAHPRGVDFTVREALDEAATTAAAAFDGQPDVRATIQATIGDSYLQLGAYEESARQYEEALASLQSAGGDEALEAAWLSELSMALVAQGRALDAEPRARQSLEIRTRLFGRSSAEVAESLHDLGVVLAYSGKDGDAKPLLEKSLAIRRSLPDTGREALMESTADLAAVLHSTGEFDTAEPLYRETLQQYRSFYGPDHPDVASLDDNLGVLLAEAGRHAEAKPLYEESLRIRRAALGDHPLTANSLQNLGRARQKLGDLEGAEAMFLEALAMRRRILDPGHPDIAKSLSVLAGLSSDRGDLELAEQYAREAIAIVQERVGSDHPSTAIHRSVLARVLFAAGRWADAATQYELALAPLERTTPDHWRPVLMRLGLAQCRLELGQIEVADSLFREADAGAERPGVSTAGRREILEGLIRTAEALGEPERAERVRERLAEIGSS